MYEFLILGNLARGAKHGYLIARIINDMMGPFRCVSWGALYPVLKKLVGEGLIRVGDTPDGDGRTRTVYVITDAGRDVLHDLLMNTDKHLAQYDWLFAHKVSFFPFLTPDERMYLCRHYAIHAQQNIDHQVHERKDLESRFPPELREEYLDSIFLVIDHNIAHWRGELTWAQELIARCQPQEAS